MAAIALKKYSKHLFLKKIIAFSVKFNHCVFLWVQLTQVIICSSNGLELNRQEAVTWTSDDEVHWRHI